MSKAKARLLTILFMAMFVAIMIFIASNNPGSIVVMAYIFAVPGIFSFARVLYLWIGCDGRAKR